MPSRKITKEEQKATEKLSKERLKRIMHTRKHRLRTNARVLKYGAKSFVRNTWLSVAAIAIMAVTLLVLAATGIATDAMGTAINKIEQQVDMSIYLKQSTSRSQVDQVVGRLSQLDTVIDVTFTSPEEAFRKTVQDLVDQREGLTDEERSALRQSLLDMPNEIAWTINVKLINLNNTEELENFVNNDELVKTLLDEKQKPSYASNRRGTIENIANIMDRIKLIGLAAAGIFAVIAILVVFNTIRMAIYNRKEEIRMMRLVGASHWFIVGPFVTEASFYGIVAAAIAGAGSYAGVFALKPHFGTTLDHAIQVMQDYWYFVIGALVALGIIIGVISALLATRKYLKHN